MLSGGVGGEQQRPGRLRDRRGAAGQGEAREAVRPEKDQAGGHDHSLPAGDSPHHLFPYSHYLLNHYHLHHHHLFHYHHHHHHHSLPSQIPHQL